MSQQLITALQNKSLYNHPVSEFTVLETYTSWVLLTGQYAYKIKKPVDFGFLDYTSLNKRLQNYQREISLNRRLAPDLYLDLITISGNEQAPKLNGSGNEAIEYAVKMREFPQHDLFDHRLAADKLSSEDIQQVATVIADFHQQTDQVSPDARFGSPDEVIAPVQQNFDQIRPLLTEASDLAQLDRLETWAKAEFARLLPIFKQRKATGFIRNCHGDLHLGNIVYYNKQAVLFDRIEFNEEFRFTDTMADLGFLVMDLEDKKRLDFAHHLINSYLQRSGDYAGLAVLPFYIAYRAMVRAKVAVLTLTQANLTDQEKQHARQEYLRRATLAEHYCQPKKPALLITHGLSGSGKSTLSNTISDEIGTIQLISDIERKRLFNLLGTEKAYAPVEQGIYKPEVTLKVYARLLELAKLVLAAGYTPLVDATFLLHSQRKPFNELATKLNIPFIILHTDADIETIKMWMQQRLASNESNQSDAYLDVLARQQKLIEPLDTIEQQQAIKIDMNNFKSSAPVLQQIENHIITFREKLT